MSSVRACAALNPWRKSSKNYEHFFPGRSSMPGPARCSEQDGRRVALGSNRWSDIPSRRSSNCRFERERAGRVKGAQRRSEPLTRPSAPAKSRPERRRTGANSQLIVPENVLTYTCLCCSHTETFETAEAAFEAGWDVAPYFTLQPRSEEHTSELQSQSNLV